MAKSCDHELVGPLRSMAAGTAKIVTCCLEVMRRTWWCCLVVLYRPRFRSVGHRVSFDPKGIYSFENITVGRNVTLGYGASLVAPRSEIHIGNHVMLGPGVMIRGGNHRIDLVGRFMIDVGFEEKRPSDDLGVTIGDDVWIGARTIILHGVTIGRGAVVGAGAVVTRSIPPYAVAAGVPARVIRFRWPPETILCHEACLYPPGERLSIQELEESQRTEEQRG